MNFVERWVAYAQERTEAPEIFHKYMAYMAVSSVLGNRAWFPWTSGRLFPNLFILFLSESASFKSTAINMIRDVLNEIDENIEVPSDVTSASLANVFKKYKQGFLPVDEFSIILRAEDGHFSTVKTMLTSVYDCPRRYRLPYRMQEDDGDKQSIEFPVFSLVAAITPHTFVKDADAEDMKGGFLSRFITVPGKKATRSIPTPPGVDWDFIRACAENLKKLRDPIFWDATRPILMTDGAREVRGVWYKRITDLMDSHPDYIDLSNSVNRARTYAIKFAMLHSVIEGRDHLIDEEDVREGINIADAAIEALFRCMKNLEVSCSDDKWVKNMAKAEGYLTEHAAATAVSKTDLYKHIKHISKRDMDNILTTLRDSGRVKMEPGPNGAVKIHWNQRVH
jgi:hypothetical protein